MSRLSLRCLLLSLVVIAMTHTCSANWLPWTIRRLNGEKRAVLLDAQRQIVTSSWKRVVRGPYLVYMPEKDRLLMTVGCDTPLMGMEIFSDDHGATWTAPRYIHTDDAGKPDCGFPVSVTYLGAGRILMGAGDRWQSTDYGNSWANVGVIGPASDGKEVAGYQWDPYLVDRATPDGPITRLAETGWSHYGEPYPKGWEDAFNRFSTDGGKTWGGEVRPPQWHRICEVALVRAANGDIVAGCRTSLPPWYKGDIDNYGGLATSVSHDDGKTWSDLNLVYDSGRHHPSFAVLRSGDLLMVYIVRCGYPVDPEGFPQFGIEAVLSHDNGQTWDMAHRFILDRWSGTRIAADDWWSSPQSTSTVLLPDGSLLTAYGTGFRCDQPMGGGVLGPHDIGLVHWRVPR